MSVEAILREKAKALITEQIISGIIQGAVTSSIVLSSFTKLPNMTSQTSSMRLLDALPLAYWVNGDTGMKQTTSMQWATKTIHAEELAVIVPIPESVIADSSYNIWDEVKPRIIEAFGKKIDEAILFGMNKPSTWRDDVVTTCQNVGNVIVESKNIYKDIMGENGLIFSLEKSGYSPTTIISSIPMKAKLRGILDSNNRPIFKSDMQGSTRYSLDGVPMYFPMNGTINPNEINFIIGDFSKGVYSIRQDISFDIFKEGTIQDPETGNIVYNLMQNDMIALRTVMRLAWEILNPINSVEPDGTKRCPFAVYKPKDTDLLNKVA